MRRLAIILILLSMVSTAAAAQQFWEKKKYDSWSREECRRMLEDSPWAQRYTLSMPIFAVSGRPGSTTGRTGQDVTGTGGASALEVNYIAQLRSALPMRQAVVQQTLLQAARQQASVEQMQAMRDRARAFLNSPTAEIVLVHFVFSSNDQNLDRAMAKYWQEQKLESVKDFFSLIGAGGRRVAPLRYEVLGGGGREFALMFPRFVNNGEPLISKEDESLTLEFYLPELDSPGAAMSTSAMSTGLSPMGSTGKRTRAVMQFKVKNMVRDGEVIY